MMVARSILGTETLLGRPALPCAAKDRAYFKPQGNALN